MNINDFTRTIKNYGGIIRIAEPKIKERNPSKELLFILLYERPFNTEINSNTSYDTYYDKVEIDPITTTENLLRLINTMKSEDIKEVVSKAQQSTPSRTMMLTLLVLVRRKDAELFKKLFPQIITNPIMLGDFIELNRSLGFGFGKTIKEAIAQWLKDNITPYYAIKYRKKLAEAIKIAHMPPDNPLFDYILAYEDKEKYKKIEAKIKEKYPQIAAFEEIKYISAKFKEIDSLKTIAPAQKNKLKKALASEIAKKIEEYNLDYSTISSFIPQHPEIAKVFLKVKTSKQLIKSLRSLLYQDILQSWGDILFIKNKLQHGIQNGVITLKDLHNAIQNVPANYKKEDTRIIAYLLKQTLEELLKELIQNTIPSVSEAWTVAIINPVTNDENILYLTAFVEKNNIKIIGNITNNNSVGTFPTIHNLHTFLKMAKAINYPLNKILILTERTSLGTDWIVDWKHYLGKHHGAELHFIVPSIDVIDLSPITMEQLNIHVHLNFTMFIKNTFTTEHSK